MVEGCDFFHCFWRWSLVIPFLLILNRNLYIQAACTPLLPMGSCSSSALVLYSEFSLVWKQASPPEGRRPRSSHLAPLCRGCTVSWVHHSSVSGDLPGRGNGRVASSLLHPVQTYLHLTSDCAALYDENCGENCLLSYPWHSYQWLPLHWARSQGQYRAYQLQSSTVWTMFNFFTFNHQFVWNIQPSHLIGCTCNMFCLYLQCIIFVQLRNVTGFLHGMQLFWLGSEWSVCCTDMYWYEGNRAWGGSFVMFAWSAITSAPNTSMQWMERMPICTSRNWIHFGTLLKLYRSIRDGGGLIHVPGWNMLTPPKFHYISWFLVNVCM